MKIRLLEDALVNQIAAGEVVERPASVVKELVENALDAGASRIAIELKAGGRTLVAVADDGEGMDRDDAMMALERHATSKIRSAEDLEQVRSLGFRGEALPSIASVSRFELLTRQREAELGTRVRVEGGELRDVRDAGAAPGTEIRVRNLFFNVPVRRRFLRTAATEVRHCLDAVTREALAHPRVGFSVRHDGRTILDAPPASGVGERAVQLLGEEAKALVALEFEADGIDVKAHIAPPHTTRASGRQATFLYVNGRAVKDRLLQRAVREAYRGRLPAGRFPLVVVRLAIDPLRVDVNVHPSKVEVRFREPREVAHVLSAGLREALEDMPGTVSRPWQRRPEAPQSEPLPFAQPGRLSPHPDPEPSRALPPEPAPGPPAAPAPAAPSLLAEGEVEPARPVPAKAAPRARVVGLLRDRVLLADDGEDLLLVDVRAARAAVAAAELRRAPTALGGAMRLLVPRAFPVGEKAARALVERAEALRAHGLDLASHSAGEILIKAAPAGLRGVDWEEVLPSLALAADLPTALGDAHAAVQDPPTEYARKALLAALDELDLLGELARRVPVHSLLGEG